MSVCLIPARGGSKRVPRKNIKTFHGKPIIFWSIKAAQDSGLFNRIIVSTDDQEISNLVKSYGAEVPFLRPSHLADDHTPTIDVIKHAITELEITEPVCCLYATAPFVSADDLKKASELLSKDIDFVMPITSFPSPIERSLMIDGNNQLKMKNENLYFTRSQDLQEYWHDVGMFYWGNFYSWLRVSNPFEGTVLPLIIPRIKAQDIDTLEDWEQAETLFPIISKKI